MDKVAVIVPFYNCEPYFEQCLNSLAGQDYGNYEIWLIDDQSPDRSMDIAERFRKEYPQLIRILRNEENMGQGRSRMRAVEATDADYVMFVDSDDYVAPDYIRGYMDANTGRFDLLAGAFTKVIGEERKPFHISDSEYTLLLYSVACCKAFRRAFLLENGIDFSDSRKGEDIYFSLACYACRPRYKVIPYAGYYYRDNPKSTTRSMNHAIGFETIVMEMFDNFRRKFHPEKLSEGEQRKIEYTYVANMVNALVVYNRGCGRQRMREKLDRFRKDLEAYYPDYRHNRDLRLFRPKEVSRRIRTGVGAFYWSSRLHLDRILFGLIAMI